jgi:hypothetical protein
MTGSNTQPMDGSPVVEDPGRLAGRLMQRAWNRDGLPEIAVGLFFVILSGAFAAQHLLEREWPVFLRIPLAPLLIVPLIFVPSWAIKQIRGRYLIERTGYVVMRPLGRKKRMRVALMAAIVGAIAVTAVVTAVRAHISSTSQWVLVGTGVLGGVLFPICGRAWRFVFPGAVFAVTGILLGLYNVGYGAGWVVLYGVAGVIVTISGAVVLLRFLRQTREAGD